MRTLRVKSERLGQVAEIVRYLESIENAYNHIFAFDLTVQEAKERYAEDWTPWGRSSRKTSRTLVTGLKQHASAACPPAEQLTQRPESGELIGHWSLPS